jgi:hypothetical protein
MAETAEATKVFEREFLQLRAQILALSATFDRLDRASGRERVESDERLGQVRKALQILSSDRKDRAEQVQLIFSDPYQDGWIKGLEFRRG